MEKNQKIEALVSHIVEECEKRELTIEETIILRSSLAKEISNHITSQRATIKFVRHTHQT